MMTGKSTLFVLVASMLLTASTAKVSTAEGFFNRANGYRATGGLLRGPSPTLRRSSTEAYPRLSPAAPSNAPRLPAGRNYYQGRYYGNLNNRFYGPQYGYF